MKRRLLAMLCLTCVLMNLRVLAVSPATSGDCGDNATWYLSDSGVLTISGSGAIRDYIYEGASLWPLIKAPWREHSANIQQIVINSGITSIGDNAFCCLPNVTSVSIPGTVTVIGQAAFSDNYSLNNVTIPNSVTIIEKSAFNRCRSLTNITLSTNLTSLGEGAFNGCGSLSSITLPPNLSEISYWTFAYCRSLKNITIPEGVTIIQNFAFGYSGLTNIKLPVSLQQIAPNAFCASNLTQITIPANVTYIMSDAFGLCHSLQRVQFTGSAPSFDSYVFSTVTTTAYYPKDNPSWTEEVRQNYGGTITWLSYCGNGHTWGQWKTEQEATCVKTGLRTRSCTQCDMREEESIALIAHQYHSVVTPPTCKEDGFTTHTCEVCNDSYIDSTTPAGTHVFDEWVVLKESTCIEKGSRQHSCVVCQMQETEEMELADHFYHDEVTAPSCTQKGFTTHTCTVCEHTFVDASTEITDHTFGEWIEIKTASWREEGEQYRQCVNCPEEQTQVLPKLPVNWGLIVGIGVVGIAVIVTGAVWLALKKKQGMNK